jgi:hypothetical protein
VCEDCPWVFSYYSQKYSLYHNWFKNFEPMDYGYGWRANYIVDYPARSAWLKQH